MPDLFVLSCQLLWSLSHKTSQTDLGPGYIRDFINIYHHQVKAAVRTMTYLGEGTFTGSAIHQANQVFRAARPGVRKVAIVITDGQADERDTVRLEEAVKEANGSNIETFVIGVVNQSDPLYEEFKKELHLMASDPDREHVYLIDDFRTLPGKQEVPFTDIHPY